jgi:DNA-binding CsgD family transcriptional regulator
MATTNPISVRRPLTVDRNSTVAERDGLRVASHLPTPRGVASVAAQNHTEDWATPSLVAGLSMFDECGLGFVICDARCGVLSANDIAQRIISMRDGLEITADNVLVATEKQRDLLSNAILEATSAASGTDGNHVRRTFAIPRPHRKRAFTAVVQAIDHSSRFRNPIKPLVLLLIMDATTPHEVSPDEFQQLFGFTASESVLANLLMEGKSLGESCDQLGIRRSTGCSHLRRMFKKTGVHQQSHLVALILRSIGLLRAKNPRNVSPVARLVTGTHDSGQQS